MTTTASSAATEPDDPELEVDSDIDFTPQAHSTIARLDQLAADTQRRHRKRTGQRTAR